MNLGEKIRYLRTNKNFTQPELAEAIGIEQSFLSKLETGKSIPSGDVFAQILDVFDLGIGELVDDLGHGSRLQLRQIPSVATHFSKQREEIIGNRRRWLLVACASLSIGVGLFYGGFIGMFMPNTVYQYQSEGVTLEGERKDIFRRELLNVVVTRDPDEQAHRASLKARLDEDFLATRTFRGTVFNVPVDGGSRTYHLDADVEVESWVNKAAATLGLILASLGLVLLVVEKKLARYQ